MMPVYMRVRENPCKRCKGQRGWYRIKATAMVRLTWKVDQFEITKPVIDQEYVECPRCAGHGYVAVAGDVLGVADEIAARCNK